MMLVELTTVPQGGIPLNAFKDHLRLGSGFSDGDLQDGVLEGFLRAAIAAVEARTGKVLIERAFSWTLTAWRNDTRQPLPLAPVNAISQMVLVDSNGTEVLSPDRWTLRPDMQRPTLEAKSSTLPAIPCGGHVRIEMLAGFGPEWSDLPVDLAHACFMLAAHYYEYRMDAMTPQQALPFGVAALIEPYRTVRLFMGGRT
ncbi:phage conserved hypothetical protein, phiE125 gp8 family [Cognatiyoonia koreensis]|uniref:Phage gp6-like head-tail connector protein n=1 Tax=Cognatiyoonia koreensis TaxID=364200 RepID=A0A1I0NRW9_9RHOB|nr:phage head-tail connector protein [Cognatiyoonia koreensis]SEW04327.1 phage conserved hypothetical protein, phiE125 gp8 family [Cognatiyoonia koreensis]